MKKIFELFKKKSDASKDAHALDLPSYMSHVAIYRDRLRVLKWVLGGMTTLCFALVVLQEARVSKVTHALVEKDYLIVPGAPEFMRIRPGFIAVESVYLFAEYVASQMSTFSYNTVENQFRSVAEYMTPELKTRFLMSTEKSLKMYKDLRVDQVFDVEPVKTYALKNDERGPKYIVRVRGATRQYIEGVLRSTVPTEILNLELRPRKIKQNQPWFFEISAFTRMTPEEEEKLQTLENIKKSERN